MPVLNKISAAEKEQYCQNIYQKYIFETSEFLVDCEDCSKILQMRIPSVCYTNFRDALFHFRRMVKSEEENTILSQANSVMEHANRAITDAKVAICMRCATLLRMMLSKNRFDENIIDALREQIDILQDWSLKLRTGGMMLVNISFFETSNEQFLEMMKQCYLCISKYAEKEFQDIISYLENLKKRFGKILGDCIGSTGMSDFQEFKAFATYNDIAELVYESLDYVVQNREDPDSEDD